MADVDHNKAAESDDWQTVYIDGLGVIPTTQLKAVGCG